MFISLRQASNPPQTRWVRVVVVRVMRVGPVRDTSLHLASASPTDALPSAHHQQQQQQQQQRSSRTLHFRPSERRDGHRRVAVSARRRRKMTRRRVRTCCSCKTRPRLSCVSRFMKIQKVVASDESLSEEVI